MKYMLDTNICIYVQKNKPSCVLERLREHQDDGLCISVITLAELVHGVEKSIQKNKNMTSLIHLLDLLEVLPFDVHAAYEYGKICATLQKKGTPIGIMDTLIAAHAKSNQLIIVTNNTREFSRISDLMVENWV